jgi:uracil-DNA glycosylase
VESTADKILSFYQQLSPPSLCDGIQALTPYTSEPAISLMSQFYKKYYNDNHRRLFLIGINPGRFGGGVTGIPFTDPIALQQFCRIENNLDPKTELSSKFMYEMINVYGGAESFYKKVYFTSVSPIGFVKNGININYYDSKELTNLWIDQMVVWLKHQLDSFGDNSLGVVIGMGKNQKFMEELNKNHRLFKRLIPVPHPRWIMQYKLKDKEKYISEYLETIDLI